MNFAKVIGTGLTVVLITGCATAQLDGLVDVKSPRGFQVPEPVPIQLGGSAVMMSGAEAGLLAGYYLATKENANGTFYLGTGHCVWYKGKDSYSLVYGGVWVPKTPEHPTRLFSVVGYQASMAKDFAGAASFCRGLDGSGAGSSPRVTPSVGVQVQPASPAGQLTAAQVTGGAVGSALAQALADSARGEYQIWQKVEDPSALKKLAEALNAPVPAAAKNAVKP